MCGIAGFITTGAPADRQLLKLMCDRLAHRGPDAYGSSVSGRLALGHRRLSIIDLATGEQPVYNEDGTVQVIFNGEIYNYRELRSELERAGHRFATQSDTEVLVHLYEEYGERMAECLQGMFAFAIWDGRRQRLFLARDRFGKKPLYYSQDVPGMRLAFASELKALAVLPGFPDEVDPGAVARFLCFGYVPDPGTIQRSALKLPPAHTLTLDERGSTLRRYWEPRFEADGNMKFERAVEEIRCLGADAVKRRTVADVPLGAFLSGGVDSSAVVGMMAGSAPARVKTFSIGFTSRGFDELSFARQAAAMHATEHHEQVVTPSIADMFETLAQAFDEPFGDASAIPSLYLARMTREHVTVALSGDGADEIFGGYRRYFFGVLEDRLRARFPGWFRRTVIRTAGELYPKFDYLPQVFRAKSMLSNLAREIGDAYFNSMTAFRDESLAAVLAPEVRRRLAGDSPRDEYRQRFEQVRHLGPLEQMQAVDFQTYLPGDILVKADRSTMAYSLEGRSPWLDHRLAELAGRLPSHFKVRGRRGKHVFKEAVAGYLPPSIVDRRKMGFAVPLAEWFRTDLRPLFEANVYRPEIGELLCLDEVRRLWAEHQSGLSDHSRKLWNLLMLARWDRERRRARAERWTVVAA